MNRLPHIMVFDSGAGGLSIAKSLLRTASSSLRLSYFADRSAFPYGNKTEDFLISHVSKLIGSFIEQHQPDLIVVACNTASTIALPELRQRFASMPFVGVVPAIKPAARLSKTRCIGVLATPATVKREYTKALIQEFAPDCKVVLYGSDALVRCAENYINSRTLDTQIIAQEITQLIEKQPCNIDTIVLACTHFPLIADALKAAAPNIKYWVDSSEAISRRTFDLLSEHFPNREALISCEKEVDVFFSTEVLEDADIDDLQQSYLQHIKIND